DWDKYERLKGIKNLVGDVIALRTGKSKGSFGLREQDLKIGHFNNDTKILSYVRGNGEPVLMVFNFSSRDFIDYGIGMEENRNWQLRFDSSWKGYDKDFLDIDVEGMSIIEAGTDGKQWTGKLNIPGYSCQIYTL
ncbi:alpha amylase C-terminal domain-containing protein, partial [Pricia sp.]|uniref:alpha amylase C-terminal domain-containing protein n=1 Tax=Pricia sp. TaxID=2268138 RepID=UPI00359333D9